MGHDVTKPVSKPAFCDVHYLRQMLFCVFTALHRAQRKLAFHHADLRLANIMEALPTAFSDKPPDSSLTPRIGTIQAAAMFDSQHVSGVLQHLPSSLDTPRSTDNSPQFSHSISSAEHSNPPVQTPQHGSSQQLRDAADPWDAAHSSQAAHAARVSQASAARFKMIDFGLADFRETYGAGYVTAKHDTLIHREPHRQPSLQSLVSGAAQSKANLSHPEELDGRQSDGLSHEEPQASCSNQKSRIEWINDDQPGRRASRKFFPVPAALLPEVGILSSQQPITPAYT